jgi:hypothetical protein
VIYKAWTFKEEREYENDELCQTFYCLDERIHTRLAARSSAKIY